MGVDICHVSATCSDVVGGEDSYSCICNNGYVGDGFSCLGELHFTSHGVCFLPINPDLESILCVLGSRSVVK